MIEQLLGQFATKDEMNKRFAQLAKKIKEILELLRRREEGNDETAMLSKKHLGPVACASCEKNLVNLEAVQADHYPWKKLPFKDPNERIARFGPGFSRILS